MRKSIFSGLAYKGQSGIRFYSEAIKIENLGGKEMRTMVKKALGVITAIAMVGSMAACGSKKDTMTAEELYAKAMESSKQDMEVEVTNTTTAMGMTIDSVYNMKTKNSDDAVELAMTGTVSGMELGMYYVDNWMYIDMGEYGKMKMEVDASMKDEYLEQMGVNGDSMLQADASDFSELKTAEDEDGNTVLTYVLPADKVSEVVDSASSMLGEDMEDVSITYGDMTGSITFDKNNEMIKQTQNVTMTMEMTGVTMNTESKTEYTVKATGEDVKITYPDFSDYEEVDSSELFGAE